MMFNSHFLKIIGIIIKIKNPLNFIHVNHWEWELKIVNWIQEKRLKSGLHNMNEIENILKKREIDVKYLNWIIKHNNWNIENIYTKVDYDTYMSLWEEKKYVKIASKWTNIYSKPKTLFSNDINHEDIALIIKKSESDIKWILEDKWLPKFSG